MAAAEGDEAGDRASRARHYPRYAGSQTKKMWGNQSPRRQYSPFQKMPSRDGLLPARPPLRTVRESFPSYGSSPHKATAYCRGMRGDPRRSAKPRLYAVPLGNTGMLPKCTAAPWDSGAETHQPTGVGRHLLSQNVSVPHMFSPFQTRPTWAYPARYTLALAFSVFPMLRS